MSGALVFSFHTKKYCFFYVFLCNFFFLLFIQSFFFCHCCSSSISYIKCLRWRHEQSSVRVCVWIKAKWQKTMKLSSTSSSSSPSSMWAHEKWFFNVNTAYIKYTYFFLLLLIFRSHSHTHSYVRHYLDVIPIIHSFL